MAAAIRLVIVDGPHGIQAIRQWDNIAELPAGEYFLHLSQATTGLLDQLNAVIASIRYMPCTCMSVAQLGERDPGCARCQAADLLYSVRTNISQQTGPSNG